MARTSFSVVTTGLVDVYEGSTAWGDFDSDGRLDLLITGNTGSARRPSSTGTPAAATSRRLPTPGFPPSPWGHAAWGDWNSDGRLDIALAGQAASGDVAAIYRNNAAGGQHAAQRRPTGLAASADGSGVTFSWAASSDTQTAASGLSYNLRVGTTPGGQEIVPAMAITTAGGLNGVRTVPSTGGAGARLSATLALTTPGTYYWSVQAVDTSFAGSPFATEATFSTPWFENKGAAGLPPFLDGAVAWGDYDNDGILDLLVTGKDQLSPGNYYAHVYHNSASGTFTQTGSLAGASPTAAPPGATTTPMGTWILPSWATRARSTSRSSAAGAATGTSRRTPAPSCRAWPPAPLPGAITTMMADRTC